MSIHTAQSNPFIDLDSTVVRCEECGIEVDQFMALCETCMIERFGLESEDEEWTRIMHDQNGRGFIDMIGRAV